MPWWTMLHFQSWERESVSSWIVGAECFPISAGDGGAVIGFLGKCVSFLFWRAAVGEEIRVSEELRERDVLSSREESFSPASDTIAVSL